MPPPCTSARSRPLASAPSLLRLSRLVGFALARQPTTQQFPDSSRPRGKPYPEPKVFNGAFFVVRHPHLKTVGTLFSWHSNLDQIVATALRYGPRLPGFN